LLFLRLARILLPMYRMNRRRFVLASFAGTLSLRGLAQPTGGPGRTRLTLHSDRRGSVIPASFVGLSYETQQLSEPSFFAAANTGLVAQVRELSPAGVLRLGGNTSDYGFWKPTPQSVAPPRPARPYKVGDPRPALSYAITPEAIHNLRGFLDATGWTCLYGINLGTNTPALAAEEAAYVSRVLGAKLEYFQIGNEADRFGSTIRDPKTWSANTFLDEWLTFAQAILGKVPGAQFGMPDIASNARWFSTIADRLATNPIRKQIACLTHHYYIGGPPSNPDMTVHRILQSDPRVLQDAALVREAAEKLGTRWRMTEGNTCYRGGKPGVSDVFASALWSADYMLELASLGYAGVNLHGGDGQFVANSVGGRLPGDDLVKDDPAMHPHPYYTPIAHIDARYVAEPVSFGMRFAQHFAGTTLIPLELETGGVNATAYAARTSRGTRLIAIINKDEVQPFSIRLPAEPVAVQTTTAAMLDSTQVTVSQAKPQPGTDQTVGPYSMALFELAA
jgi:hypothetical protein